MIAIQTMKVFSSAKYPKCPGGGPLIFLLAATLLSPLSSLLSQSTPSVSGGEMWNSFEYNMTMKLFLHLNIPFLSLK